MLELASQMTGHSVKQPVNGNLRLVTESGLASHFYAELISHFIFSKSNAVVDIVTGTGEAATSAVESGEADAAIVNLSSREAVLEKVELGESELVLVTAETCLAQFTADAQYLVWSGSRYLIRAFAERPELRAPLRSVDLELIIQALSSGFGYAFLPRWSVSAHLKSGKLREIAAPFPTIVERCGIVYSCGNISPALNAFIAAAHEYLDRSFSSASSIRAL
jgi:DNA-binding transcriptional LysR family regulator